ncbi:MAG TPA: response regulator [Thermoanaerobaculia bacterium]|nr:response regulator [Thermoanaerobaculia bacterium]
MVDDDLAIRTLIARILERKGVETECAQDGAEAIEKMTANHYHVVVLDLMMPKVTGFEVVEHVRNNFITRPAIVLVTAGVDVDLRTLDGTVVHSVVRKPFDIHELGDLITVTAQQMMEAEKSRDAGLMRVIEFPTKSLEN